ncbi:MAG: hypothetical protein GY794_21645, partial [bacterium]|nr:hypothetical protein [bacterium]
SEADDKIAWYENDGSENFTAHTITTGDWGARSVATADVDGDGDLDVLSASINHDKIAWYENASTTTLDGSPIITEDDTSVVLDTGVEISDSELDGLNGGNGDYDGASVTLVRDTGANADDFFKFNDGDITLSVNSDLLKNGQIIATFDQTTTSGQLVITFTNANGETPTSTDVDNILRQITYANNGSPPASLQLDWTFDDGNTGSQGTGSALQALGATTVYFDFTDAAYTVVVDTTSDIADGDTSNVLALMSDKGADGMISLREAILATNNTVNDSSYLDRIEFDFIDNQAGHYYYQDDNTANSLSTIVATTVDDGSIGDFDPDYAGYSWWKIDISSALPTITPIITDAVVIDGYSQSGSSENTLTTEGTSDAILRVSLEMSTLGADGLVLEADNITIQGLNINAEWNGIVTDGYSGHTIRGNYINTDITGTQPGDAIGFGTQNPDVGVWFENGSGHTIGGVNPGDRNIMTSGSWAGIVLKGVTSTTIQGN